VFLTHTVELENIFSVVAFDGGSHGVDRNRVNSTVTFTICGRKSGQQRCKLIRVFWRCGQSGLPRIYDAPAMYVSYTAELRRRNLLHMHGWSGGPTS